LARSLNVLALQEKDLRKEKSRSEGRAVQGGSPRTEEKTSSLRALRGLMMPLALREATH
jgi:hypothetical protein